MSVDWRPRTAESVLAGLEECGWFEALPRSFRASTLAALNEAESAKEPVHHGLVVAVCEGVHLLDDKPYSALLREFVRSSAGAITLEAFEETSNGGSVRFVFGARSARTAFDLPPTSEDVPRSFVSAINRVVAAQGSPLRFLELRRMAWGPIPAYTLTTIDAFNAAVKKRILREQEHVSRDEGQEEAPNTAATASKSKKKK